MTPTGTASTSCSIPSPAQHNAPAWNCCPSADDSSRSANATSTVTPGSGSSRSAATSRSQRRSRVAHAHPPAKVRDLLHTVYQLTADGRLPLPTTTHYPLADAATAVRVMRAAEHSGKLVLDVPVSGHSTVVVSPEQARVFRRDGAYLITGGLGGLGLFLAAEDGRRRAAAESCSRRALRPDAATQMAIDRIRSTGADIVVECGDIADPRTADRVVAAAIATGLPVCGVLHAAAVVEDATLANITDELIDRRLGAEGRRRVEPAPRHRHSAVGLVLRVLLGGRARGLAGSGGVRRGQQLAGRLHPLAPQPGASGHRDRVGSVGRDRPCRGACGSRPDSAITSRRRCLRVRDVAASRPRATPATRRSTGAPWLTALAHRSPFAEVFRSAGTKSNGHKRVPCRADTLPPRRVAVPAAPSGLRSGQPDPASHDRSGPPADRVRPRLARQPRTAYPHRDRDGCTRRHDGYHHRARFGRDTCATSSRARRPRRQHRDRPCGDGEVSAIEREKQRRHCVRRPNESRNDS